MGYAWVGVGGLVYRSRRRSFFCPLVPHHVIRRLSSTLRARGYADISLPCVGPPAFPHILLQSEYCVTLHGASERGETVDAGRQPGAGAGVQE